MRGALAATIKIPKSTDEKVNVLMGHLGIEERPIVLRIALSKGVFHFENELPEVVDSSNGREIPLTTLCPANNYLIIKHCLIQKLGKKIDSDNDLYKLIRRALVYGIDLMVIELSSLNKLENYLVYLVENLGKKTLVTESQQRIKELLGF